MSTRPARRAAALQSRHLPFSFSRSMFYNRHYKIPSRRIWPLPLHSRRAHIQPGTLAMATMEHGILATPMNRRNTIGARVLLAISSPLLIPGATAFAPSALAMGLGCISAQGVCVFSPTARLSPVSSRTSPFTLKPPRRAAGPCEGALSVCANAKGPSAASGRRRSQQGGLGEVGRAHATKQSLASRARVREAVDCRAISIMAGKGKLATRGGSASVVAPRLARVSGADTRVGRAALGQDTRNSLVFRLAGSMGRVVVAVWVGLLLTIQSVGPLPPPPTRQYPIAQQLLAASRQAHGHAYCLRL
jgi:hypothetical protein